MDEKPSEAERERPAGRMIGFVRRRPLLSLGLLAGAGALGGVEWAAGALLGLGVAGLVVTPAGRELGRRWTDRARALLEHQQPHDTQSA